MDKKLDRALWVYAAASFLLCVAENAAATAIGKAVFEKVGYEAITFWTLIFGGVQTASSHLMGVSWWRRLVYRHWRALILAEAGATMMLNGLLVLDVIPFQLRWILTTVIMMMLTSTFSSFWEFFKQDSGNGEKISVRLSKWMISGMFVGRLLAWVAASQFHFEPTANQAFIGHLFFSVFDSLALLYVLACSGCMKRKTID